jgi:hypothetical protein
MLAVAAIAGCGGGSGGGGGGSGPLAFSQFESSYASENCRLEVLCEEFPSQALCLSSAQMHTHEQDTLVEDVATGKVVYDAAMAQACIDALTSVTSCTRNPVTSSGVDITSTCGSVLTGAVALGASCFYSGECALGGACQTTATNCTSSECCAGVCVAQSPTVGAGGDCSLGHGVCAPETVCVRNPTTAAQTCQAPVGAGAPCTAGNACTVPLFCDTITGTCQAPAATGAPCDYNGDGVVCANPADRCNSVGSVCMAPLAVGSACDPNSDACVSYATCDANTRSCAQRPTTGQTCDPYGPSCLASVCDSMSLTCTVPPPTPGACW